MGGGVKAELFAQPLQHWYILCQPLFNNNENQLLNCKYISWIYRHCTTFKKYWQYIDQLISNLGPAWKSSQDHVSPHGSFVPSPPFTSSLFLPPFKSYIVHWAMILRQQLFRLPPDSIYLRCIGWTHLFIACWHNLHLNASEIKIFFFGRGLKSLFQEGERGLAEKYEEVENTWPSYFC